MTSHPRLDPALPLLWRDPTRLQAGLDPGLVWPDAPPGGLAALAALDGTRTVTQAAAEHRVPVLWLAGCVRELTRLGRLAPVVRGRVAVLGEGAMAEAVRGALPGGCAAVLPAERDWRGADVVVLAGDTAAPSRAVLGALHHARQPYLVVSPTRAGATVGPFWVPGESACARCLDLTLAARDRAWPALLAQLELLPAAPSAAARAWAAGLAAAHVSAWLQTGTSPSLGSTWDLSDGDVEVRRWRRHPDCRCGEVPAAAPAAA